MVAKQGEPEADWQLEGVLVHHLCGRTVDQRVDMGGKEWWGAKSPSQNTPAKILTQPQQTQHCAAPHLQEALHAAGRVLRPLPIVAVGQQYHQAALAQPLGLAAADKLVKDDLQVAEAHAHRRASAGMGWQLVQISWKAGAVEGRQLRNTLERG